MPHNHHSMFWASDFGSCRDIKTQHVPERAISWLVATGPYLKSDKWGGTWVAQLVEYPTLAQVMISRLVGPSPSLGSVLTAGSLEPASDSGAPSLCPSPTHACSLSLSQKINKHKKKNQTSGMAALEPTLGR